MKIFKIEIENYRLLRDLSLDVENELSLVIGKNNTGKTSILSVLDQFLNDKYNFSYHDLNIKFKGHLKETIEAEEELNEGKFTPPKISLKIYMRYFEQDDLDNISQVMMDLDPENDVIVLGFEYSLSFSSYKVLREDLKQFLDTETQKAQENPEYEEKGFHDFLNENFRDYFKSQKKSLYFDHETQTVDEERFIDLLSEGINIRDIISFKLISARRDVANKDKNKTLSGQTSKIYKSKEDTEEQVQAVEDFKDKLSQTDTGLSCIYDTLFKDIADKVREFGGVKANESDIKIISTLQQRELLEGNTTVVYKHDEENQLPEYYNGLGYMNLISMIFEIEILVSEFKRTKDKKPADINLLFIEEPEAHTHPQMQYVFIKNIKKLLKEGVKREDGENRSLQYIISTHSACILADSDFEDVKYLRKENEVIIAKNLKDLAKRYDDEGNQYKFLKQYLTINRAEIFFADKVVLIEGDTERILIPTIMHKIDIEEKLRFGDTDQDDPDLPLLSQNISIVEVGAHFKIFKEFIDFIGIKTLIITDIDSTRRNDEEDKVEACRVEHGTDTSNSSIKHFYEDKTWEQLTALEPGERELDIGDSSAFIAYQTMEDGYHARSFEDAFIQINRGFIENDIETFNGLKKRNYFSDQTKDSYDLAEDCINKKTHFALDIIYHSDETLSNWSVPAYIKDGLLWLKKD